eukprot:TRINITY_DN91_c0_g1_i1.p1 TRINITY_DN91_c0_g1~~TRINITY_DN91_c0_g1_i1.p1  ORF type:complete len:350 (-),score=105.33 TRINITY_DN91_c0_g1_i1:20-1069(-)
MKSIIFLCLLTFCYGHGRFISDVKGGFNLEDDFENNTAFYKQQYLWKQCVADTTSGSFSQLKVTQLFIEDMSVSFTPQDTFDGLPGPLGFLNRSKVIHSVASVGRFKYTSVGNHNYTGIFKGDSYGIMRLSTPAAYDSSSTRTFTPAFVFKFFRDFLPSANLFGINTLEGSRDSFNYFKHDAYANPVHPSLDINIAEKAIMNRLLTASDWLMMGTSDAASYDQFGNYVEEPVFPFNIIWQATEPIRNMYPDTFISDYLPDVLSQVPADSPLFNVWADEPNQAPVLIGLVTLDGVLTSSNFGDNHLYFAHVLKENDFALRPDWVSYATQLVETQANSHYYNGPEDIPYPQ